MGQDNLFNFDEPCVTDAQRAAEWKTSCLRAQAELSELKRAVIAHLRRHDRNGGFPDEDGFTCMTQVSELAKCLDGVQVNQEKSP